MGSHHHHYHQQDHWGWGGVGGWLYDCWVSTADLINQNRQRPTPLPQHTRTIWAEKLYAEYVLMCGGLLSLSLHITAMHLLWVKYYEAESPPGQVWTQLLDTSAHQSAVLRVTWVWHLGVSKILQWRANTYRIKGTRRSFMAWRAANSPCSSHHLLARDWNLLSSSASTVVWEAGQTLCTEKETGRCLHGTWL